MTEDGPRVRTADPEARRQAVLLVVLGALAGLLLLVAFQHYRVPIQDWLLSEPARLLHRIRLVFLVIAAVLSLPLVGLAAYLWSIGDRIVAARAFPLPGQRVIRDTPVIVGAAAVRRGRGFKFAALCLASAAVMVWLVLVQWANAIGERMA